MFDNRTDWELLKDYLADEHGEGHHDDDCDICGAIKRLDETFSNLEPK